MKKVIVFALLISGCSSLKIYSKPCDSVANREDLWVCGKDTVVKTCRPILGLDDKMVCEK